MAKQFKPETLCVQAGWTPKKGEPRVLPIYQSTTFKYDTSEQMARLFDLEGKILVLRPSVRIHHIVQGKIALLLCPKRSVHAPVLFPVVPFPGQCQRNGQHHQHEDPQGCEQDYFCFRGLIHSVTFFQVLVLSGQSAV